MPDKGEEAPQKFVYKFRLEPPSVEKNVSSEIDQEVLQSYINGLLGVKSPKKSDLGDTTI